MTRNSAKSRTNLLQNLLCRGQNRPLPASHPLRGLSPIQLQLFCGIFCSGPSHGQRWPLYWCDRDEFGGRNGGRRIILMILKIKLCHFKNYQHFLDPSISSQKHGDPFLSNSCSRPPEIPKYVVSGSGHWRLWARLLFLHFCARDFRFCYSCALTFFLFFLDVHRRRDGACCAGWPLQLRHGVCAIPSNRNLRRWLPDDGGVQRFGGLLAI